MRTKRMSLSRSVTASLLAGLLCCIPLNNTQAQLSLGLGGGASLAGAATVAGATHETVTYHFSELIPPVLDWLAAGEPDHP